jgi:site-specific DNA-cytosine methylase
MRVLVACEFSGIVREAFKERGHDAWSCDLLPTEIQGQHIQGNVLKILNDGWDLMIAHPPCTHLAVCGAPSFKHKIADGRQQGAIDFFMSIATAHIGKIAIENPICIMSSRYRKPDQIIQPCYFGDADSKKICLWLKNLPPLYFGPLLTNVVEPKDKVFRSKKTKSGFSRYSAIHESGQGHQRSRFFQGIANAMAEQWR